MNTDSGWIIIDFDDDRRRLSRDAERLRLCYPGRYDFRVTPDCGGSRWALSVRHRS